MKRTSDRDNLKNMALNGARLVHQKWNWNIEETKLLKVYKDLLGL